MTVKTMVFFYGYLNKDKQMVGPFRRIIQVKSMEHHLVEQTRSGFGHLQLRPYASLYQKQNITTETPKHFT